MFEVSVRTSFSGAHHLKGYRGKCEAIHGHNWDVEAVILSEGLNSEGLSVDFKILKKKLSGVLAALDHRDLNKVEFFRENNPSAENIARYIYVNFKKTLKGRGISLRRVNVWETKDSCAAYFE